VLDHVERGRLAVQPAREDTLELVLQVAHVHLHERTGERLRLPGRRCLAGLDADDDVFDAPSLAGAQPQLPFDAVALVEDAEHRHALGHRRGARRQFGG
jgi:hypothetical protein